MIAPANLAGCDDGDGTDEAIAISLRRNISQLLRDDDVSGKQFW
jgi:hypothetical protein